MLSPTSLSLSDPTAVFVVLRRIGHGSFGSVFLAAERESGRTVAIKVLPLDNARAQQRKDHTPKTWLDTLRHEIGLMRSISSPSVVRFHGSFVTPMLEAVWIIMEACESSLLDLMSSLGEPLVDDSLRAALAGILLASRVGDRGFYARSSATPSYVRTIPGRRRSPSSRCLACLLAAAWAICAGTSWQIC